MKRFVLLLPPLFFLLASCSLDRYVQPGQKILHRNVVEISMADSTAVPPEVSQVLSGVQSYYIQTPNKRLLGLRPKMRLYCSTNPTDTSRWANFLRKQGEAPVIYSAAAARRTQDKLTTLMKTKGCFGSTVSMDTVAHGSSSVEVHYHIVATPRRAIDSLRFRCRWQKDIDSLLQASKGESLLQVGDYYDQDKMTEEQVRIATLLKNHGYYYASTDSVRFWVDTTYEELCISVRVRTPNPYDSLSNRSRMRPYRIHNIYIYPNITTTLQQSQRHLDTLIYPLATRNGFSNYHFVYDKPISPSPKAISQALLLRSGQLYHPRIASATANSLFSLNNFKLVDISFEESEASTPDNPLLDAKIRLLSNTRHRLTLSFELTNASNFGSQESNFFTSGNVGLGTAIGYQNNNLFGGAEVLHLESDILFDLPKNVFSSRSGDFHNTFSTFENGLTATLDLPSFLLPMASQFRGRYTRPHTLISLNFNYLYRQLTIPDLATDQRADVALERNLLSASFGYTWTHQRRYQHRLMPFNLSFSHILSGKEYYTYLFQLTHDMKFLYQAFDYVLLNTHYEYTYTNQRIGTRTNFDFLTFSVETAGNLMAAADYLLGNNQQSTTSSDISYYQYLRLDGEYKRYIYLGNASTLVLRGLAGIGLPYGHSTSIPYEKMFVGGGPNTMRGWALRYLGYGQYPTSDIDFAVGMGEIQLVTNIEGRFPLFGIFEGALFADAGNVWRCEDWGIGPNRTFSTSEIVNGIALDAGLGLRANVSIITLRLDLALPLRDPGYAVGQRWIGHHWAWNKIVANLGINYPF